MNAVEIEQAISALAEQPFDTAEFPFAFLQAFGNKEVTIKKLRAGASNRSDLGGVLQTSHIHILVCAPGGVSKSLAALKASPATNKAKARFILTTDGVDFEAEDLHSGETVACAYEDFPDHFGFFLSLAGIRREGSVDGLDDIDDARADRGSTRSQQVAEEAFAELAIRAKACDGEYPFELEQGLLRLRDDAVAAPYLLLLLLSFKDPTSGHAGTAAMFERLCAHAAKQYFGGEANGARAFRFGSPRKVPLAKLSDAIDFLCKELSEGGGVRDPEYAKHTGDEGLDIVAWKHFSDHRAGKLIAFGQCAGGRVNWTDKLNELDGQKFASKLFRDRMVVAPIRFFFVPRRVPRDNWENVSIDAGVVFDRCRIVSCLKGLDPNLRNDCAAMLKALTKQAKNSDTQKKLSKKKRRKTKRTKKR